MKKILAAFAFVLFIVACNQSDGLPKDKVVLFFSTNCPHCHNAIEYINKEHPRLEVMMVNVGNQKGMALLVAAAKKFKLGERVGTPLIVFGDEYMMGWGKNGKEEFEEKLKLLKK